LTPGPFPHPNRFRTHYAQGGQDLLPALSVLIDLQEIDKEILALRRTAAELPEEVAAMAAHLAELQGARAAIQAELEGHQKQHRDLEGEIKDLEESIHTSRQRLMEIKNNIEYRALLKEIGFKEDQRDQKETRILELLERMEELVRELAAQAEVLAAQEEALARRKTEVAAKATELADAIARLEGQRQGLMNQVPPDLLKRYEFIRQRRNGSPLAEVVEGVCQGCHMNILPQQFIDLQKGLEIIQCPHCQRILYWLGEPESEAGEQEDAKVSRQAV